MANLSAKELTALEDQLGSEQTLIKQYRAMACLCNDMNIQQEFNNIAERHQQHYNTLMTFLQ